MFSCLARLLVFSAGTEMEMEVGSSEANDVRKYRRIGKHGPHLDARSMR